MIPCIDFKAFWQQVQRGTISVCSIDTANICAKMAGGITVYGKIVRL